MMPKPAEEWMIFALDDLDDGEILFRESKFNGACFHAQQAAEKALKGFIVDNNIPHPRTHDLIELNDFCVKINREFNNAKEKLTTLNQFYMPSRYPDAAAGMAPEGVPSKDLARKALDYARDVVKFSSERIRQVEQQKIYYKPEDRETF